MKVVTICGSMKFADKMKKIARKLEVENCWCVLQSVYNEDRQKDTVEGLTNLIACHNKKIDISDAVYVMNIGGYVGEATRRQIDYAKKHKKEIIYHEQIQE